MERKYFIGIDVSKKTLDISLVMVGVLQTHIQIENTTSAIQSGIPKLLENFGARVGNSLFCMEHTGMYNQPMLGWLKKVKAKIWMESAYHIIKSQGLTRGKNDKVDSARIAHFAYTHRHKPTLWEAPLPAIKKMSALVSQRSRLVNAKTQLQTALREQKQFLDKVVIRSMERYTKAPLQALQAQVIAIDKGITDVIKKDITVHHLYKLVTSVTGVGPVIAVHLLVTTNAFQKYANAKRFACSAGVVPFNYSSGTAYHTRAKVSNHANKTTKALLHMAALNAIRTKGELQDYYLRKVAEGKNKMSVINAVRNKIVLRVFACVKRNDVYQKERPYVPPAVVSPPHTLHTAQR